MRTSPRIEGDSICIQVPAGGSYNFERWVSFKLSRNITYVQFSGGMQNTSLYAYLL